MILKFKDFLLYESKKMYLGISEYVQTIRTKTEMFDMMKIKNRRFMYHPKSGELILGVQDVKEIWNTSHAGEHGDSGSIYPFDEFVRGWVGTGCNYPNGIIHFAPHINTEYVNQFEDGYSTVKMFLNNGANSDTILRGFGTQSEFKIKDNFGVKKEPVLL